MTLPITKKNVLKFMPCTESRLFQALIPDRNAVGEKKHDKLTSRLVRTIAGLTRKEIIKKQNSSYERRKAGN